MSINVYLGSIKCPFECRASFQELCAALEDVTKLFQIGKHDLFEQHVESIAKKFFQEDDHKTVMFCILLACTYPRSAYSLRFVHEESWLGVISEEALLARSSPRMTCSTIHPKEQST